MLFFFSLPKKIIFAYLTRRLVRTTLFILILFTSQVSSARTMQTVSFLRFPLRRTVSPRNNCSSSILLGWRATTELSSFVASSTIKRLGRFFCSRMASEKSLVLRGWMVKILVTHVHNTYSFPLSSSAIVRVCYGKSLQNTNLFSCSQKLKKTTKRARQSPTTTSRETGHEIVCWVSFWVVISAGEEASCEQHQPNGKSGLDHKGDDGGDGQTQGRKTKEFIAQLPKKKIPRGLLLLCRRA